MILFKICSATIPVTTENTEIAPQQEGLKVSSLDFKNPLTDCGVAKKKKSENYLLFIFRIFRWINRFVNAVAFSQ